jgi:hypothetical protein
VAAFVVSEVIAMLEAQDVDRIDVHDGRVGTDCYGRNFFTDFRRHT